MRSMQSSSGSPTRSGSPSVRGPTSWRPSSPIWPTARCCWCSTTSSRSSLRRPWYRGCSRQPRRPNHRHQPRTAPDRWRAGMGGAAARCQFRVPDLRPARECGTSRLCRDAHAAIDRIIGLVDGLPLAVELAASQVRHLTPETIQARLERSLTVAGGRPAGRARPTPDAARDARLEHRSPPSADPSVVRLSAFAGGWTLEAAERVCADADGGSAAVLGTLAELVESSLVHISGEDAQGVRYWMHQLTREYAAELFAAMPDHGAVERRHAEWVLDLFETAEPHLVLRDLGTWEQRVCAPRKTTSAEPSAGRSITARPSSVSRIGGACWQFWFYWAELREGITWLEALAGPSRIRDRRRARGPRRSSLPRCGGIRVASPSRSRPTSRWYHPPLARHRGRAIWRCARRRGLGRSHDR